jgi:hypothetical protein
MATLRRSPSAPETADCIDCRIRCCLVKRRPALRQLNATVASEAAHPVGHVAPQDPESADLQDNGELS